MDETRKQAYLAVLAAGLLHIKWDLACLYGGFSIWKPWHLRREMRNACRAAWRAAAFHNLAILSALGFQEFSEERFWNDIENFHQRYAESRCVDYRGIFQRALDGKTVMLVSPSGGGSE